MLKRVMMLRKSILTGGLMIALSASAGVQIVSDDGIVAISDLAKSEFTSPSPTAEQQNQDYDSDTRRYYSEEQIKRSLFRKYKSVQQMLLHLDKLDFAEKNVVRELAIEQMMEQERRLNDIKTKQKVTIIQREHEKENSEYEALNDPEQIKRRREFDSSVAKAQNKPIFENDINVRQELYDPSSTEQILINNRVNRPTVVSFFDVMGSPYPIAQHIPDNATTKSESFNVTKVNSNQLLIVTNADFKEVSGFVFLKGAPQPVAFLLTSNADQDLDAKINIALPTVSPDSELTSESIKIPFEKLNKDDDHNMSLVLSGRPPAEAKSLHIDGLPRNSTGYRIGDYYYIRTQSQMKYEVHSANRFGSWYVFKAYPKSTYYFYVNNKETRVTVDES